MLNSRPNIKAPRALPFCLLLLWFLQSGFAISTDFEKSPVEWTTLDRAIDAARRFDKKILVHVHADWCGYCRVMEASVYGDTSVANYVNEHFAPVQLDATSEEEIWFNGYKFVYLEDKSCHQLAYQLLRGKTKFPATLILNKDAEVLTPVHGFMNEKHLLRLLRYFAEDKHKEMSWKDYVSR